MSAAETRARGCTATAIRCACVKVFEVKLTLVIAHYNPGIYTHAPHKHFATHLVPGASQSAFGHPGGLTSSTLAPPGSTDTLLPGWPCVIPFK